MIRCLKMWLPLCLAIWVCGSSCKIWNPNQMFRTPPGYEFAELTDSLPSEIVLRPGDRLAVQVFSNDGYSLLTPGLEPLGQQRIASGQLFEVDVYGYVRFPFIDTFNVAGMKVRECERALEDRFQEHFKDPFAQIRVVNRRVFVFRGNDAGQVILLDNDNMTLIEVLALAGGIPSTAKAYKIKLVRGDINRDFDLSQINLRTADGVEDANLLVRHGDVIYIDPTFRTTLFSQILPIFSFVTTAIGFAALLVSLGK